MLVIVAAELDAVAVAAASSWNGPARVCTPADLSRPGWSVEVGNLAGASIVADAQRVSLRDVRAIVNVLPGLAPPQLFRIEEEDRTYAAIEGNAFLTWLLAFAPCPVTNRATAASLHGCGWGNERWNLEAQRCGLLAVADTGTFTLVGDTVFGSFTVRRTPRSGPSQLESGMRLLARTARMSYLRIEIDGTDQRTPPVIRRVHVVPDLSDQVVVASLRRHLLTSRSLT